MLYSLPDIKLLK